MKRGNLLIKNASQVVTCSGSRGKAGKEMQDIGVLTHAYIVVEDGVITCVKVGDVDDKPYVNRGFEVIDATGKCVLPGFVDSHTHLVFGGYRQEEYNWRLNGVSYMEIMRRGGGIANTVNATREASVEALVESGIRRLNTMASFGVTTAEGKSGYGLDLDTELKQLNVMRQLNKAHSLDIITTFLGPHAVPEAYKNQPDAFIDFMIDRVLPEVDKRGLAEFADIFCEKDVFSIAQSERFLKAANRLGFKLKIHADEIVRLGGAELAAELKATSADHLLAASDAGLAAMRDAGVVATLLPNTAFSLKTDYARARDMIDMGLIVALATDLNPGSCFTESIPLLIALATREMRMTIEEVITALTINGAAALERADQIGSIDIGKKADLVVHEFPSYAFLAYHIGVSTVEKVIKNGVIILDKAHEGAY